MTAAHPHPPAPHRFGWHADADVDGSDPWYWFVCDERWRMVATYRASDANHKERFVYHNAGLNGMGGSSYIDSTILRDADDSAGWASAAPDSTLQTRYYYLQNWRADVVALIEPDGDPMEYVRYSPYGVPFVYAAADVNRDGQVDILDTYAWDDYTMFTTGDIAVSADVNRDGAVNGSDAGLIFDQDSWGVWASSGRGFVSRVDSRKGYAGYEFDPATTQWHVRHRVLVSEMGRWGRRDPAGYVAQAGSLVSYSDTNVILRRDPQGRDSVAAAILAPPSYDPAAEWACASYSNSSADCYACCNQGPGSFLDKQSCYRWCNAKYRPPSNWPGFYPNPSPDGPCFTQDAGACANCCARKNILGCHTSDVIDGQTVRICCVCVDNIITQNHDPSGIIQDCVSLHEQCHAFQGPDSSPESACNELLCYQRQLECLNKGRARCGNDQSCISALDRHVEQMQESMMYYFDLCRSAF